MKRKFVVGLLAIVFVVSSFAIFSSCSNFQDSLQYPAYYVTTDAVYYHGKKILDIQDNVSFNDLSNKNSAHVAIAFEQVGLGTYSNIKWFVDGKEYKDKHDLYISRIYTVLGDKVIFSADGTICCLNIKSGNLEQLLQTASASVIASPNQKYFVLQDDLGEYHLCKVGGLKTTVKQIDLENVFQIVAVDNNGNLYYNNNDNELFFYNGKTETYISQRPTRYVFFNQSQTELLFVSKGELVYFDGRQPKILKSDIVDNGISLDYAVCHGNIDFSWRGQVVQVQSLLDCPIRLDNKLYTFTKSGKETLLWEVDDQIVKIASNGAFCRTSDGVVSFRKFQKDAQPVEIFQSDAGLLSSVMYFTPHSDDVYFVDDDVLFWYSNGKTKEVLNYSLYKFYYMDLNGDLICQNGTDVYKVVNDKIHLLAKGVNSVWVMGDGAYLLIERNFSQTGTQYVPGYFCPMGSTKAVEIK